MPGEMTRNAKIFATVGVGLALFLAALAQTIVDLFPPDVRARMQGIFGGIFGLASVVGPTVGGYLTDNVGWRWVFYVNVPVGILAVLAVVFFIPRTKHESSWRDIDFAGAALLAVALVPMLIAFSITRDHDIFSLEVLGLLVFSAVAWIVFFFVEQREQHPMVPFTLFKNQTFA